MDHFETFARPHARSKDPAIAVAEGGRFALNAATARLLADAKVDAVLLRWDKVNRKMALQAAPRGDPNTYAVTIGKDKRFGSLRAEAFTKFIGWSSRERRTLPATWNERERMLVVLVPAEFLTAPNTADAPKRRPGQRQ